MTLPGLLQIALFAVLTAGLTKPLGFYMARVFAGETTPLKRLFGAVEYGLYRASGVDPVREQSWKDYAFALLAFNLAGFLVLYGVQRLQLLLPINPQRMVGVSPDLALNTAISFTTNTSW